jgi:hypothetical protein
MRYPLDFRYLFLLFNWIRFFEGNFYSRINIYPMLKLIFSTIYSTPYLFISAIPGTLNNNLQHTTFFKGNDFFVKWHISWKKLLITIDKYQIYHSISVHLNILLYDYLHNSTLNMNDVFWLVDKRGMFYKFLVFPPFSPSQGICPWEFRIAWYMANILSLF